jgi:hypothetical protein
VDAEREDWLLVMQYLRKDPETFLGLLTLARLECDPRDLLIEPGGEPTDKRSVAGKKREIERYFASAFFGWCAACFQPVVSFPDGERIDWPARSRHKCKPEVMDAPKPRYKAVAV